MKNFTEQLADINEQNIKLRKELELTNAESDRKTQIILALRLDLVEIKSKYSNKVRWGMY